jgi:cytochrome c553
VYGQCVGCHGGTGLGVPSQFPPLVGSPFVLKGEKRLIAILLKGITGPLTVEGKPFNNTMPPWEAALSDKKIAAVASFIRQEWGNKAGEISEAKVKRRRRSSVRKPVPGRRLNFCRSPKMPTSPMKLELRRPRGRPRQLQPRRQLPHPHPQHPRLLLPHRRHRLPPLPHPLGGRTT